MCNIYTIVTTIVEGIFILRPLNYYLLQYSPAILMGITNKIERESMSSKGYNWQSLSEHIGNLLIR